MATQKKIMINGEWYDYPDKVIDKLVELIHQHEVRIKRLEQNLLM